MMNKKMVVIIIIGLLIIGSYVNNHNSGSSDNHQNPESINTTNAENNEQQKVEAKKIYKTSSEEYKEFIKKLMTNTANDYFALYSIKWSSPYAKVDFYETSNLDVETFNRERDKIINILRDEMSQNKYKRGGLLETDFEYVSVAFFKKYSDYSGKYYKMETFEEIDVYKF